MFPGRTEHPNKWKAASGCKAGVCEIRAETGNLFCGPALSIEVISYSYEKINGGLIQIVSSGKSVQLLQFASPCFHRGSFVPRRRWDLRQCLSGVGARSYLQINHNVDTSKLFRYNTAVKRMFSFSDLTNQVETTGLKLQKVTAELEHYRKLLM